MISEGCIAENQSGTKTSKSIWEKTNTKSRSLNRSTISCMSLFVSRVCSEQANGANHGSAAQDVREARSLSKESTPEEAGEAVEYKSRIERGQPSKDETKVDKQNQTTKSEYERTREANIAKNAEIFRELGKKYPLPYDVKEREKKATKEKKKAKEPQEPRRCSARIQGPR